LALFRSASSHLYKGEKGTANSTTFFFFDFSVSSLYVLFAVLYFGAVALCCLMFFLFTSFIYLRIIVFSLPFLFFSVAYISLDVWCLKKRWESKK
jgi:hypothetical protein